MPRNRGNDSARQPFPRHDLENLCFGEKRIVEDGRQDLRMAFGQQRSRDARRPAARQHDLLSQRDLRKTADEQLFRLTPKFPVNRGLHADLHQIEHVEVAQEPHTGQARRMRMRHKRPFYPIALQERLAPRNLLENPIGKLFALEQQAEMRLVEGGMIEKREQCLLSRIVQKHENLLGWRRLRLLDERFKGPRFLRHARVSVSPAGEALSLQGTLRSRFVERDAACLGAAAKAEIDRYGPSIRQNANGGAAPSSSAQQSLWGSEPGHRT